MIRVWPFLVLCLLGSATNVHAQTTYALDDGGTERVRGAVGGADGLVGNLFSAQSGGDVITTISVAWGSPFQPGFAPAGTPIEVLLYDDPDDDGQFDDLVLLVSGAGVITSPDSDTFVDYAIPPTTVNGNFFVATIVRDLATGPSPIATDDTLPRGATFTQLQMDIDTTAISPVPFPNPGNAMVRATGVPEPSAVTLIVFAIALVMMPRAAWQLACQSFHTSP